MHETIHENELASAGPPEAVDPLQPPRRLGLTPSLTSEGLGWRGTKAERYRHSLREIEQPPFESHLDTLVLRLWRVEKHREGRVAEVSHAPGDIALIPAGGPAARFLHEGKVDVLLLSLEPVFVEEMGRTGRNSWITLAHEIRASNKEEG